MKKQFEDFELIDLDQTAEWSKLEVEEAVNTNETAIEEEIEYLDDPDDFSVIQLEESEEAKPEEPKVKKKVSSGKKKKKKKEPVTVWEKIIDFAKNMTAMDRVIAATGAVVVAVAIITVSVYTSARAAESQVAAMAPIGEELELLGTAGQDTLVAVADARKAMIEFASQEEEIKEYDEKEESETGKISVTMSLTSVQKDLKIKFINAKTKKLVSNVGFKVSIKDADGKTSQAEDDDKDGIIYIKSMTPGKTTVTMLELADDSKVSFSTQSQTVTVKEKIDYKKIDVSDEVKTEKQVNAKVEDTAVANAVEATLTDTVEWVESTRTEIGSTDGYAEVKKDTIADPAKSAQTLFIKMDTLSENDPLPSPSPATPTTAVTPSPEPTPTSVPTPSPVITPQATPSPIVTPSPAVTPTKVPTPTPTKTPASQNKTSLLKDKSGNQIYIKNSSGKYVEAKYADYYTASTFYKKSSSVQYKYTGWQELDGKTYFFDKNGNKVTGEQVIQGAKYTFASDGSLVTGSGTMGIDVSKWNGKINWTAVKNSGVSYVIIRCGYRGSSTGALIEDPMFKTNIQGATNAGLKVGIYFFTQAVNEVEAVEEASMTIGLIKNYRISYPVFLDVEASGGRADGLDAATRTSVINAYCQTIRNSGYTAGVYANKTWLTQKMNAGALSSYKIWLAQYNTAPTYAGKIDLWQYTSQGNVGGISGYTDMNLSYLGY